MKYLCFLFLILSPSAWSTDERHALYLMHSHEVIKAIDTFQKCAREKGSPNYDILQKMFWTLMKQGAKDPDPETQLLTMFGAGLALHSSSLDLLEQGLHSKEPQIQLVALHFIAGMQDQRADDILLKGFNSNFLNVRIETGYYLAQKKHPHAVGQLEALMHRLPYPFRVFFPPLFAMVGSRDANNILRRMLNDPSPFVRISTILSIAHHRREDLLEDIRKKTSHADLAELEALATCYGMFRDSSRIDAIRKMVVIGTDHVKIAAHQALFQLGDLAARHSVEDIALQKQNPFAIHALGYMPNTQDTLMKLLSSPNLQVRMNAAISLLRLRDPRCLPYLKDLFIRDMKDLAIQIMFSPGRALPAFKIISSAEQRANKDPYTNLHASLNIRETLLQECALLPEEYFLTFASLILNSGQKELVPQLIHILEKLHTPRTIDLLVKNSHKNGNPFVRDYCNLALFRMQVPGPYEEYLKNWIKHRRGIELIRLRPLAERATEIKPTSHFELSPEESSRLLVEVYASLAAQKKHEYIDLLLSTMKSGNEKNRYALAGLLMRATE